ncbi:hypothetical protein [Streptomyces sp. NPDC003015]
MRTRTAKDGSSHTRWCTQVIGLTRQAVSPVSANAAAQSTVGAAHQVAQEEPGRDAIRRTTPK